VLLALVPLIVLPFLLAALRVTTFRLASQVTRA
jgi:hypothetical protein